MVRTWRHVTDGIPFAKDTGMDTINERENTEEKVIVADDDGPLSTWFDFWDAYQADAIQEKNKGNIPHELAFYKQMGIDARVVGKSSEPDGLTADMLGHTTDVSRYPDWVHDEIERLLAKPRSMKAASLLDTDLVECPHHNSPSTPRSSRLVERRLATATETHC